MVLQLVQGLGFNAIISLTFGAIIPESLAVAVLNLDIVNAASSGSAAHLKLNLDSNKSPFSISPKIFCHRF